MSNSMTRQHGEVFRLQQGLVPHLDGVTVTLGKLGQKPIQHGHEVPPMAEILGIKVRELKDEDADLVLHPVEGAEERLLEEVGIQEVLVGLASQSAKAREVGVVLDGDGVCDLEAKTERIRDLFAQAFEVLRGGKLVVAGIHADGWKYLCVFSQAFPLESGL